MRDCLSFFFSGINDPVWIHSDYSALLFIRSTYLESGFDDVWGGSGLPMPFFCPNISVSVTESLEKKHGFLDFCPDRQARVNLRDPKALANFLIHSDIKLIRAEYRTQTWPSTTSLIVVTSDPSGPA